MVLEVVLEVEAVLVLGVVVDVLVDDVDEALVGGVEDAVLEDAVLEVAVLEVAVSGGSVVTASVVDVVDGVVEGSQSTPGSNAPVVGGSSPSTAWTGTGQGGRVVVVDRSWPSTIPGKSVWTGRLHGGAPSVARAVNRANSSAGKPPPCTSSPRNSSMNRGGSPGAPA